MNIGFFLGTHGSEIQCTGIATDLDNKRPFEYKVNERESENSESAIWVVGQVVVYSFLVNFLYLFLWCAKLVAYAIYILFALKPDVIHTFRTCFGF